MTGDKRLKDFPSHLMQLVVILFLLTERQLYLTLLESFQNHQQGPKLLKTGTVYGDPTLIKYTITYLVELPNLLLLLLPR
jgi:hypothetical protein